MLTVGYNLNVIPHPVSPEVEWEKGADLPHTPPRQSQETLWLFREDEGQGCSLDKPYSHVMNAFLKISKLCKIM